MSRKRIFYFIIACLIPIDCFAYLDPGSGNALLCLILSLGGAILYSIKRFYYKIVSFVRGDKSSNASFKCDLLLFSEGKTYWFTFKPIIEELISRKIHFIYYSMDLEDPALTIDHECMHSRYICSGVSAYARISSMSIKNMLVTTPNIGCSGYPISRSKNIGKLMHVSHAVSDISYYKKGSLDHYDVSLDVGKWCEPRIRKIEQLRNLKRKECIAVGLPYLDELLKNKRIADPMSHVHVEDHNNKVQQQKDQKSKVVLIAPSWGNKNCLNIYSYDFIISLLRANYKVILRPHPQSMKVEKDFYDQIVEQAKAINDSLFTFDLSQDATTSMQQADFLISDSSSFKYDFAFLYQKPVITMKVAQTDLSSYEADDLGGAWDQDYLEKLGVVVSNKDFDILEIINKISDLDESYFAKLYDQLIVEHGRAAVKIVDYIESNISS